MWKYKSMVMLFLISILLYVVVHLPFESGLIVFDMRSFQPVSAIPVVIGLFFGPAGVLGVGIGSFLIDLYRGLTFLTPFIMLGNMFMALLAYRLWDRLLIQSDFDLVIPKSGKRFIVINLLLLAIITAMAKSLIIGWGYALTSTEVFYAKVAPLFINDAISGLLLSIFFIFVFLKRLRKWEMIWSDLMKTGDVLADSKLGTKITLYSIPDFFLISLIFSYFGFNIVVIVCGALALLTMLTGLFWESKVA